MPWTWKQKRAALRRRHRALLRALGGQCAWPDGCTFDDLDRLQVDHVDGRAWQPRDMSWAARIRRYEDEHASGVRLRPLCPRHNGAFNPHRDGEAVEYERQAREHYERRQAAGG